MYLPAHFAEPDAAWALDFIERVSFGHWVSTSTEGLVATPMPWLIDREKRSLLGHVARANSQWHSALTNSQSLVIFSDANAYVSPNFYPSKAEHHRVVPTWNYDVVHVSGRVIIHDDETWLRALVTRLTAHHERAQPKPWRVADAPEDYLQGMLKNIVGIEIAIDRIEAKRKLSQNREQADRWGVIEGLGDNAIAKRMSERET